MKQTAGSWLLVRFARGGETKARPSQLRALRSDEALTEKEKEELAKPFDPVRDVQDAVDADVRVAAADGGFVGNVFIDRDGTERRQFEAYALPGGGVGARCGVCGLDQVLPESALKLLIIWPLWRPFHCKAQGPGNGPMGQWGERMDHPCRVKP